MKDVKSIVKGVLNSFFSSEVNEEGSYEDSFLGVTLDEDEVEIVSNAITEALERKVEKDESKT